MRYFHHYAFHIACCRKRPWRRISEAQTALLEEGEFIACGESGAFTRTKTRAPFG